MAKGRIEDLMTELGMSEEVQTPQPTSGPIVEEPTLSRETDQTDTALLEELGYSTDGTTTRPAELPHIGATKFPTFGEQLVENIIEPTFSQGINAVDLALSIGLGIPAWVTEQPIRGGIHAANVLREKFGVDTKTGTVGLEPWTDKEIDEMVYKAIGQHTYQPNQLGKLMKDLTGWELSTLKRGEQAGQIVQWGFEKFLTPAHMAGEYAERWAKRTETPAVAKAIGWLTGLTAELATFGVAHGLGKSIYTKFKEGKPLKKATLEELREEYKDLEGQEIIREANREVWENIENQVAAEEQTPSKFLEEQVAQFEERVEWAAEYELADITAAGREGESYNLPNVETVIRRTPEEINARTNPQARSAFESVRSTREGLIEGESELGVEGPVLTQGEAVRPLPEEPVTRFDEIALKGEDVTVEQAREARRIEAETVQLLDNTNNTVRKNIESQEHVNNARSRMAAMEQGKPKPKRATVEERQAEREDIHDTATVVDTSTKTGELVPEENTSVSEAPLLELEAWVKSDKFQEGLHAMTPDELRTYLDLIKEKVPGIEERVKVEIEGRTVEPQRDIARDVRDRVEAETKGDIAELIEPVIEQAVGETREGWTRADNDAFGRMLDRVSEKGIKDPKEWSRIYREEASKKEPLPPESGQRGEAVEGVQEQLKPKRKRRSPKRDFDSASAVQDKWAEKGHLVAVEEHELFVLLRALEVSKSSRGRGTGSRIMNDLKAYADKAGKDIVLEAEWGSGPFYEKHGFVSTTGKGMHRPVGGERIFSDTYTKLKERLDTGKPFRSVKEQAKALETLDTILPELSASEAEVVRKRINKTEVKTKEGERQIIRDPVEAEIDPDVLRDQTLTTLQNEIAPKLKRWVEGDNRVSIEKLESRLRELGNVLDTRTGTIDPSHADTVGMIDETLVNISKIKKQRMGEEKRIEADAAAKGGMVSPVENDAMIEEVTRQVEATKVKEPGKKVGDELTDAELDAVVDQIEGRLDQVRAGESPVKEELSERARDLIEAHDAEMELVDNIGEVIEDYHVGKEGKPETKTDWLGEEDNIDYGIDGELKAGKDLTDIMGNDRGIINLDLLPAEQIAKVLGKLKARFAKTGLSLYDGLQILGMRAWDAKKYVEKFNESDVLDKPVRKAFNLGKKNMEEAVGNLVNALSGGNKAAREALKEAHRVLYEMNRIVDDYKPESLEAPRRVEPNITEDITPKTLEGVVDLERRGASPHNNFRKMFDWSMNPVGDAMESNMAMFRNIENNSKWAKDMSSKVPSAYEDIQATLFPIYEKYSGLLESKRINLNLRRGINRRLRETSKQNKERIAELKKRRADNLLRRKELDEQFGDMVNEFDANLPGLAKRNPSVRIVLEAAGELPRGVSLTPLERTLAGQMKKYFETTRDKLIDLGIPAISDRPYMTHLFQSMLEEGTGERFFSEIFTKRKRAPAILKYLSQSPNSRIWIPDMHTILESYIPLTERKIAFQPFLNRWDLFIESNQYPKMSNYFREWVDANLYRPSLKPIDKLVNAAVAFEYARLIGWSMSVGFKHLTKLSGTFAKTGFIPTTQGLRAMSRVPVQLAKKKMGYEGPFYEADLVRAYVSQRALVRTLDEFPGLKAMGERARAILAQPTVAIEALDNGVSVLAGFIAASKKGISPKAAQKMLWETILDANFRLGLDQALCAKKPGARALAMFQSTPWKLAELKYQMITRALKGERDAFGTKYSSILIRYLAMIGTAELVARANDTSVLELFLHLPFFQHIIHTKHEAPFYSFNVPSPTKSPMIDWWTQMAKKDVVAGTKDHFKYWGAFSKPPLKQLYDKNPMYYPTGYYQTPVRHMFGLPKIDPRRRSGRGRGRSRRVRR